MSRKRKRATLRVSPSTASKRKPLRSLRDFVADYLRAKRKCGDDLKYYRTAPNIAEAIRRSAMAEQPSGLKQRHQGGTPPRSLKAATRRLLSLKGAFNRVKDFDTLHDLIEARIGDIYKIGPLAIYDTAHRLGAYLGCKPKQIYMHAGTRDGAEALLGHRVPNKRLPFSAFPKELRAMTAEQAEDFLCHCSDQLAQFAPRDEDSSDDE